MSEGISSLTAAELSQAAYPGYTPPAGWSALPGYSTQINSSSGINGFTTFVNTATRQIVVAFKGTDFSDSASGVRQFVSDLVKDGGSAWESIATQFGAILAQIKAAPSYAGYEIMTDGHSLGGGMAQTATLEYGLSGYGQNSLPISADARSDLLITSVGGYADAVTIWKAVGNTFNEVNVEGDPATSHWTGSPYLSTSTTTLASPYDLLEFDGLLDFDPADVALAAFHAHQISMVIGLEQGTGLALEPAAIDAFLQSNSPAIDTAVNDDPLTVSQAGVVTSATPDGLQFSVSIGSEGSSSDSYVVDVNGQPNQTDVVTTNGNLVTLNTEIDQGATVEVFDDQFGQSAFGSVSRDFSFTGSGDTLKIDAPASFTGTISNFIAGNIIDLVGIGTATSATLGANDVLTVTGASGGAITLQLNPAQRYASYDFVPIADGHGGTDIVLPTVKVLATFNATNGANPDGNLTEDSAGNLFGTTSSGGANKDGTAFEIPKTSTGYGTLTTLVSFNNSAIGYGPMAGLVADSAGDLFGTTYGGGANGTGSVFEIAKGVSTPTILASFNAGAASRTTGEFPKAPLIMDWPVICSAPRREVARMAMAQYLRSPRLAR